MSVDVDWSSQGKSDGSVRSRQEVCPGCGRPMKAVPDEAREGRSRYVCTNCDDDPLQDPTARKSTLSANAVSVRFAGRSERWQRRRKLVNCKAQGIDRSFPAGQFPKLC
jgi:predicted RNA-binding Zn-ribbon protein involved in translation (DUF1610 family)